MKQEIAIIFPHQLFQDHPALHKKRLVYLIEHPRFFSDFSFNKQKLVLHRASMKTYYGYLILLPIALGWLIMRWKKKSPAFLKKI